MKNLILLSNKVKLIFLGLLLILVNCASVDKKVQDSRPNILVVLCDDLGYSDVGFNGATDITTPALDKLAERGTIFSSAYVTHPFCGPSRASIMTGRYPHPMGTQFNLPPNSETIGKGIPLEETFISETLQESGYYTGVIGKWHLGAVPKYHPNKRGFDEFFGFLGGGHEYFPDQYRAKYEKQKKAGKKVIFEYLLPLEHNGTSINETEYLTDAFTREAVKFVDVASKKEKPFFLYLAFNAPHVPLQAKKEDLALYSTIKDEHRRTYAAMVHAVDRGVEKVVKTLKETGQFDNTLIIFLSDNGGKLSKGATNYPLREGKGSACEGGYRVPMFFHWPNHVPAGNRFDYPISALDFYPTFTGLAEVKIPEGKILDGKNIWSDFMRGENLHEKEMIYCLRHRTGHTDVGARRDSMKVLKNHQEPWKLINLNKDINEQHDLSAKYPELLKEMLAETEKWSQTHRQPLWWHNEQTGIDWKRDSMPRFDETFKID